MNPFENLLNQIRELFAPHLDPQGGIVPQSDALVVDPLDPAIIVEPPKTRESQIVIRQSDGTYRWFGVAATAVLNHDRMIDSRALFDSFIARIQATGKYPQYDVLHLGEDCVVGIADYVVRDGAVYFASGTFNDDEFSQSVARGIAENPEYWGHSIAFMAGDPQSLEIYDGINIPVFTDGINQFISVVPRSRAASMFTDVTVQERGKKMMTETQYAELVKLVGEELATKKRDELALLNRTIDEAGLIQREATAEAPKVEVPIAEESKPAPPATPVAEQARAEEPKPAEVDTTKETLDAIIAKLQQIEKNVGEIQTAQSQFAERMAKVEKPIEEILADAPEPKTQVVSRARTARANGSDVIVDPSETLALLRAQHANHVR